MPITRTIYFPGTKIKQNTKAIVLCVNILELKIFLKNEKSPSEFLDFH